MGDRAVVGFAPSADAPTIYLYSHWGGSTQINDVQNALSASNSRWHDADYATRIAISALVGDDWDSETGYGLSVGAYTYPDYPYVLKIVWGEQSVYVLNADTQAEQGRISFSEFLALTGEDLEPALA